MQRNPSGDTKSGLMDYLFSFKTVMGLLCVGLFVFVYLNFTTTLLNTLADPAVSRGVITFLIAIATVGIAVITVVNSFLGTGSKEDLAERFSQGKDVLTVLIGVLGTIVGFYFAQAPNTKGPPPPTDTTATAGAPSTPAPVKPPEGTPPKVTPPKSTPPEGTPPKSTPPESTPRP